MYKYNDLNFFKVLSICTQSHSESDQILEKEKYTSHTIAHLTLFTHALKIP